MSVLTSNGSSPPERAKRRYEAVPRARGLTYRWHSSGNMAVLAAGEPLDDPPMLAQVGEWIGVGRVRLDNHEDLAASSDGVRGRSDLEVVLAVLRRYGASYISRLLGDFCFVAWNGATRTGVAACDAFAHNKLYYTQCDGLIAFASRAEPLAPGDRYEQQYFAQLVANCLPSPDLTPYATVHALPAASIADFGLGRISVRQYWSPAAFEPDASWEIREGEAVEKCRELITDAVRVRLTGKRDVWAQLSGGLDSSSVVSVAQQLLQRGQVAEGLAGTVTFVDRQGSETDERRYSNAVVSRWPVRNDIIVDPPVWCDPEYELPRTDLPNFFLPLYPRERRLCQTVLSAGGRVLLTGQGSDELFTGTMFFFADLLARGEVRAALREMGRWAAMGRVSFWDLAYRNALLPLLPRLLQRHLLSHEGLVPPWVSQAAARRYALKSGGFVTSLHEGRAGHKYHQAILETVVALGRTKGYGVISDDLEVRHPFLSRPLVEFALQLPPRLCVRPYARKWVLREAMRGILPEVVRTRIGKAMPTELFARSLATQPSLLQPLVQNPILGDLGIVDANRLRKAFVTVPRQPHRSHDPHGALQSTLIIEAWLQMRSGRWPSGPAACFGSRLNNSFLTV